MRKLGLVAGMAMLAVTLVPAGAPVLHDDPCLVGDNGDASDRWQSARALTTNGLGEGCTTESIQMPNACGVNAQDNSDWFFVNTPPTGVAKSVRVTLTFEFTFCGGPAIDADLEVYFVALGALIPWQFYPPGDGNGPGVKLCDSHQPGAVTETVTCTVGQDGLFGVLGRYYVHKTRVSGSGAHNLQVAFI